MPFVYILRCADNSLYVGHTDDLASREQTHNLGHGANYTADRRPVEMVYAEEHGSLTSAIGRERQLKRWTVAKKEALIRGELGRRRRSADNNVEWRAIRLAYRPAYGGPKVRSWRAILRQSNGVLSEQMVRRRRTECESKGTLTANRSVVLPERTLAHVRLSAMEKTVTVYAFRKFDMRSGTYVQAERAATLEAITRGRGEPIIKTAHEVDESELDSDGHVRGPDRR